ncbi:hypothetical protein Taro_036325, partial [Colocasia esculenta]|nr:hypothetical protein [Colocasia esculenta]
RIVTFLRLKSQTLSDDEIAFFPGGCASFPPIRRQPSASHTKPYSSSPEPSTHRRRSHVGGSLTDPAHLGLHQMQQKKGGACSAFPL